MKTIRLPWHSDPGHAWLEVPAAVVAEVGLKPESFSRFSYRNGKSLFLEEDCDAPLFLAECNKKGVTVEMKEQSYDNECYIRDLPGVRP